MARGGAGEQRPNSVDGLPAAADHAANVALAKLKFENGCSAARNFREHHVVGIFDQLPNDELEKFSHDEFSIIHFRSASVPQLRFLRWMAPAVVSRARAAQAAQTQLPRARRRPVSYFS
jgi:hypothetical protein